MFHFMSDQDNGQQILSTSSNSNTENSQKPTLQKLSGRIAELELKRKVATNSGAVQEITDLNKEIAELKAGIKLGVSPDSSYSQQLRAEIAKLVSDRKKSLLFKLEVENTFTKNLTPHKLEPSPSVLELKKELAELGELLPSVTPIIERNRKKTKKGHPAIQQLLALGYDTGDTVVGRNILNGKNQDWKGELTEDNIKIQEYTWGSGKIELDGQIHEDGLEWLDEENQEGKQIYFNVNGGRKNEEVDQIYAVFFEHDTGTKEEQRAQINAFPIRPSVVVETRKSHHVYFTIRDEDENGEIDHAGSDNLDKEGWRRLQEEISYVMGSDPSVKDLPRLMRLAGFDHIKTGLPNVLCTLETCDENKTYTFAEIEAAITGYAANQGIKPFTQERYKAYNYAINRLNQKKSGIDYSHPRLNPDFFRTCEDSEVGEQLLRAKDWARLCEKKHKGEDVDPETAWTNQRTEVAKRVRKEYNFELVPNQVQGDGDEVPLIQMARKYANHFVDFGRDGWHTFQDPTRDGNSTDSVHINATTGAIKSWGSESHEVEVWLRQAARDAGDPLWNVEAYKGQRFDGLGKGNEEWAERYERERVIKAKYTFTREADITVESGYLPKLTLGELPEGKKIITLKADWGYGKTTCVTSLLECYTGDVIQVAHLNALLANTAPKFKLNHHQDLKDKGEFSHKGGGSRRLAITLDSLGHLLDVEEVFGKRRFSLILDEIEQVLEYACKATHLASHRQAVRAKLEWLIKNAEYIFASDRDISNAALDYVEQVRGTKTETFIIQHTGQKGLGRKIKLNINKRKDEVVTKCLEDIKSGKKVAIPCENKSDLLAWEDLFREHGISDKVWFSAHGDNSNEKDIREVIKNIDKEYKNYQVLLYTMTLGTAVSLEEEHFDKVYGFFTGDAFNGQKQLQMIFRYRPECEIEIWVSPKKRTKEIREEVFRNGLFASIQETAETQETYLRVKIGEQFNKAIETGLFPSVRGKISDEDFPWIALTNTYTVRTNASMANPSQTLIAELEAAGFELEIEQSDDDTAAIRTVEGEAHRAIKKDNKEKDDIAVANAELLMDEDLEGMLRKSGSHTKDERNKIQKTILHKETGLEVTQELVKKDRTKDFVKSVKLLMSVRGSEEDAILADLLEADSRMPSDRKFHQHVRKLFHDLGVDELIDYLEGGGTYSSGDKYRNAPIVNQVAENLRKEKRNVKRLLKYTVNNEKKKENALGRTVTKEQDGVEDLGYKVSDAQLVADILVKVGIKLTRHRKRTSRGGVESFYFLDRDNWSEVLSVIEHQKTCKKERSIDKILDDKKELFQQQKRAEFEEILARKKASAREAETPTLTGLEGVTPPTTFIYTKDQGGVTEISPAQQPAISSGVDPQIPLPISTAPFLVDGIWQTEVTHKRPPSPEEIAAKKEAAEEAYNKMLMESELKWRASFPIGTTFPVVMEPYDH